MQQILNTDHITIPNNPSREWIWLRILVKIKFTKLKRVNSLQWAILKIFIEFEQDLPDLDEVAKVLGMEKALIEDGLKHLSLLGVLKLKPRQIPSNLKNYEFEPSIRDVFSKHGKIQEPISTQKFILFHDNKAEGDEYRYQKVERITVEKDYWKGKLHKTILKFENVLLTIIEQIWKDLESNNFQLFTKGEKELNIDNNSSLQNSEYIVTKIEVNFL